MRFFVFALSVGLAWVAHAQKTQPSQLDEARAGGQDVAWPRKPDNRLSNLSGKMKNFREIPNQEYGGSREFQAERLYEDRQASGLASAPLWATSESAYGKKSDTRFNQDSSLGEKDAVQRFDPLVSRQENVEVREERQLTRQEAMGWVSRTSRMGQATDGTMQMYEGRLVRVRQQVSRSGNATDRDLGEGRREKYSPAEVQKLLQQQPGLPEIKEMVKPALPVRAESPTASRPLAAGS